MELYSDNGRIYCDFVRFYNMYILPPRNIKYFRGDFFDNIPEKAAGFTCGGRTFSTSYQGQHGKVRFAQQACSFAARVAVSRGVDRFVCADGVSLLPCCHVRQKQPRHPDALRRTAFLQSALVTDIFQSRSVSGGFCMACSAVAAYFSDNGSFLPHFKTGRASYAAVSVMGYIRRLR